MEDANTTATAETDINVSFKVLAEHHSLAQFQAGGHFVPGMTDTNGFRRPWETAEVHILTLRFKDEQVLRVLADTEPEAVRLMQFQIRATFEANWWALRASSFSYEEFQKLNQQANELRGLIQQLYSWEIEHGHHRSLPTVFHVAAHYLRAERARWSVRLRQWLRRRPPAPPLNFPPEFSK